jgi:Holliday junction resolvase
MTPRHKAKIDANQREIVKALRDAGCEVLSLAAVGKGCPDLLVFDDRNMELLLMEVKDGDKPPSQQRLTKDQKEFHLRWPVYTVTSVDEALEVVE